MRSIMTFGAAALAIAFAVPAAAQSTSATDPSMAPAGPTSSAAPASPTAGAASSTSSSSSSSSSAAVAEGQSVKDKTGATIGKVTAVKADASGKQVATIQMGADTFAVDTAALAVDNGAAVINASQAEIKGMMQK